LLAPLRREKNTFDIFFQRPFLRTSKKKFKDHFFEEQVFRDSRKQNSGKITNCHFPKINISLKIPNFKKKYFQNM
jgi:hypothetical protein